jgi:hypothetical protein
MISSGVSHVAKRPFSYASKVISRCWTASESADAPEHSSAFTPQMASVATAGSEVSNQPICDLMALTENSSSADAPADLASEIALSFGPMRIRSCIRLKHVGHELPDQKRSLKSLPVLRKRMLSDAPERGRSYSEKV